MKRGRATSQGAAVLQSQVSHHKGSLVLSCLVVLDMVIALYLSFPVCIHSHLSYRIKELNKELDQSGTKHCVRLALA